MSSIVGGHLWHCLRQHKSTMKTSRSITSLTCQLFALWTQQQHRDRKLTEISLNGPPLCLTKSNVLWTPASALWVVRTKSGRQKLFWRLLGKKWKSHRDKYTKKCTKYQAQTTRVTNLSSRACSTESALESGHFWVLIKFHRLMAD